MSLQKVPAARVVILLGSVDASVAIVCVNHYPYLAEYCRCCIQVPVNYASVAIVCIIQHPYLADDSDTSSDCDSNASGDENIIAEAHAAEAGTANSEERSDDREAADEVEKPCGSEKWYACSCMPSM